MADHAALQLRLGAGFMHFQPLQGAKAQHVDPILGFRFTAVPLDHAEASEANSGATDPIRRSDKP